MATATADEYAALDGLPLFTAAWATTSLAALYDSPAVRGDGTAVYLHHGEQAPRRWYTPRVVSLPIAVFGDVDSDGVAHADVRTGLRRNLDELKSVLRPVLDGDFTNTLVHHHPDGNRNARCQVVSPLATRAVGPTAMRAVVDLWLPDGVMRDVAVTSATGTDSVAFDLVVPNAGTDQFDVQITLSGAATSVEIVSPAFGGQSLTFDGALGGGVQITTARQTATRDGADVHGLVDASGMGRWLVLPAGGETWTVTPTGGSVTVDVEHRAAWA